MARSVRHITGIAALLEERGIDLVVLKQGIDTTTPAGRFTFHVLAAMDEMLADLISEGTREGLESARARGRVGGRKPKLTARQSEVARGMHDETGADGRRKYTVAEIAETFGVSRKTVCRHLEPSGGRRQPGTSARTAAPAEPPATLPHPIHARISEPAARARTRPAAARAPLACPTCGREPATRHEALQQREDLAIVWLHLDGDRVTEARHCVACQPHGPVIDVSYSCCGNGPLITGQPPELGDRLAAPALDWMHSRGWQLHPQPLCPADHR
jgi:Resolvase, N terminal domain